MVAQKPPVEMRRALARARKRVKTEDIFTSGLRGASQQPRNLLSHACFLLLYMCVRVFVCKGSIYTCVCVCVRVCVCTWLSGDSPNEGNKRTVPWVQKYGFNPLTLAMAFSP